MEVFVGIEGFTLPSGFVAKEVCFLYPNWEFCHLLFKPPCDRHLSNIDRRTIRWTTNNLNNIFYQDGEVPYECLHDILKTLQLHTIWTYGEVAQRFLQDFLPTSIITNSLAHYYHTAHILNDIIKNHELEAFVLLSIIEL